MITHQNDSILNEPETTFAATSDEVKEAIDSLAEEGSPETKDEMMRIARDHGIPTTTDMTAEEIKDQVNDAL